MGPVFLREIFIQRPLKVAPRRLMSEPYPCLFVRRFESSPQKKD
ncbi:hypothetical protein C4J96_2545 [Pseudomonas orientalis]|nr:hypothetical protein C4J96_2545 [Pseudomonas orientalis]